VSHKQNCEITIVNADRKAIVLWSSLAQSISLISYRYYSEYFLIP